MAQAKKNSNFDALNVVLNVLMTPLLRRSFSLIAKIGINFVLVVPTLKVPRYSTYKIVSPHWRMMRPTAPTQSIFIALVLLREPQDLMLWEPTFPRKYRNTEIWIRIPYFTLLV